MSRTKKYVTAATTFSVALGIGFVMQYGDAVAARWGADRPVAGPATQADALTSEMVPVQASIAVPTVLSLPDAPAQSPIENVAMTPVPQEVETPAFSMILDDAPAQAAIAAPAVEEQIVLAAAEDAPIVDDVAPDVPMAEVATQSCNVNMTAVTADMAMVQLSVDSPCHYSMIATIHHDGMMFQGLMDENGMMQAAVPALREEAFFIVTFEDGNGAAALTSVPEITMYDRAVLQWQGTEDVQLHALEFGATYGDDGHVWAATADDMTRANAGQGGFLTRLGNEALPEALMAEVYTFPSVMTALEGGIALNVEAEVTARNCGREVAAQSIQISPATEAAIMDLTLAMPDCDAIGEFLVLKNMFEDLTLAAK